MNDEQQHAIDRTPMFDPIGSWRLGPGPETQDEFNKRFQRAVEALTKGLTPMPVRAKFTVSEIRQHSWSPHARTVVLTPEYDQSIPEDQRFAQATPSGRLEMLIDNPSALAALPLGEKFYIDITPVPEAQPR